jgi:hypothetical protein
MKSTTELHKEGLDQALREALGTSQSALKKQALARASTHLIHPGLVLDSPLLADNHPWRLQALAVSDAFEAVTNGMEEPEALAALDDLDPESPFQPWRHLILALHFFYQGLDEAVTAHLARIPRTSPVAALARVLATLVSGSPDPLPAALGRLADQVVQPDPRVLPLVQDVAEGLETDQEALFWGALSDWLETAGEEAPDRARAAVLWAWNQLEWRDFDEGVLLDLASNLWGGAESYRLAALGTLPWDPEGAALLWLRFLITAAREDWDEACIREARALLDSFRDAAGQPEGEWTPIWLNLAAAWNAEARSQGWDALTVDAEQPEAPALPRSSTGQLDLFA